MTKELTVEILKLIVKGCSKNNGKYYVTDGTTLEAIENAIELLEGENE